MALHLPIDAHHALVRSYPTTDAVAHLQDEQDVQRAITAFRFFYPSVSAEAICYGVRDLGLVDNVHIAAFATRPHHVGLTPSCDTAYAVGVLDLRTSGPVVIDIPPGPIVGTVNDHHQRWVGDLTAGGRYLLLPPDHAGEVPGECLIAHSCTYINVLALRALSTGGLGDGLAALRGVKVCPLNEPAAVATVIDVTHRPIDISPVRWEQSIEYWNRLHDILAREPVQPELRAMGGLVSAIGIDRDRPFVPSLRTMDILTLAARDGIDQMRVEAFASQRLDRIVWPGRQWEWMGLVTDNPNFEASGYVDLAARDRWFFQTLLASPGLFQRGAGASSVSFMASRDSTGAYLSGSLHYELIVPQPVPADLFWSLTVYDAQTRSLVRTYQDRAVVGTLHTPLTVHRDGRIHLVLGPLSRARNDPHWIETPEGTGIFVIFRLYGPKAAAFDGSWQLGELIAAR